MSKSKMTLGQALIVDWKRELKIGSPKRILQLLYPTTVMYILAYFIIAPVLRAYYWLRKHVILGYRIARHYYFRFLIWIEYGPGAYERMREDYYKKN